MKQIRNVFLLGSFLLLLQACGSDHTFDYSQPVRCKMFIANYSDQEGKIVVGDREAKVAAKSTSELSIPYGLNQFQLQAWLGETVVIDTFVTEGIYILNMSDDITLVAEENVYGNPHLDTVITPQFLSLSKPGFQFMTSDLNETVRGFDEAAPDSVSVIYLAQISKEWDVYTATFAELMELLLKAKEQEQARAERERQIAYIDSLTKLLDGY
jgi:hypothetical protein